MVQLVSNGPVFEEALIGELDGRLTTRYALVESSPEVGSSRNKMRGSWMMSTPMETRRLSPPETPRWPSSPMMVLATLTRPSLSSKLFTLATLVAFDWDCGSRKKAENMSVSLTVSIGYRRSSCMIPEGNLLESASVTFLQHSSCRKASLITRSNVKSSVIV